MEADVQEEAVENPTLYLEITVWKVVRIILVVVEAVVEIVMEIMDRIVEVRMYLGYECLIRLTFFYLNYLESHLHIPHSLLFN